jgi:site-specific DNA-methyltransferase (adenine-specific)
MSSEYFMPVEQPPAVDLSKCNIVIGDCLEYLKECVAEGRQFDAIITDPPYEIGLHGKSWDSTGIAFSAELWDLIYAALKPGGFVLSFAASRLYHRVAVAAEDAGFKLYPMLAWEFPGGLPKPANLAELFDRDNVPDRKAIGMKTGSGFTAANAVHGAQQRLTKQFKVFARGVSDEARKWLGFFYGVNTFKPCFEPIMMAQKPITEKRMIDNVRLHGTGAVNIGRLQRSRGGQWPTTIFRHAKAKKSDHNSLHPSVKPVALMQELCRAICPPGGHILDPFAGTGTTGAGALLEGFSCTLVEQNPDMRSVIESRIRSKKN